MEAALLSRLTHCSRVLEQVGINVGARDEAKVDADELPKARRVVVLHRFGVAERLEDRVGLQELILELSEAKALHLHLRDGD